MRRKVNMVGTGTLTVSLPTKWAKKFNLKKGDELHMAEDGRRLFIGVDNVSEKHRAEINLKGLDPILVRILSAYYKMGADEIEILYDDENTAKEIQNKLSSELIGYEIMKQKKGYCLVKNIANGLETEFDNTLRRAFLVSLDMADNSLEAIKKNDFENLKNVRGLEAVNNKMTGFCRRVLIKKGHKDYKRIPFLYGFIDELEKVADQYKYMIDYTIKHNVKLSKESLDIYKESNKLLREVYNLFYSFKLEHISSLYKKRTSLIEEIHHLFVSKNKEEVVVLHYLMTTIQIITNMSKFMLNIKL